MNYQNIYDKIILKASKLLRIKNEIYYEKHHIIPKCLGGTDEEKNLVLLTPKEHFICHKLLTFIYPDNRKIACAFHFMTFSNKGNYKLSGRDYQYARELISLIPISDITKQKMSISHKGKPGGMKNKKHSLETIEKMKNKIVSEETKQKLRNTGKHLSEEHKKHIGLKIKGRILSEEHKKRISESLKGKKKDAFSEEHKFKISLNNGSKQKETKIKMSIAKKGKTWEEIFGVVGAEKRRNKNKIE